MTTCTYVDSRIAEVFTCAGELADVTDGIRLSVQATSESCGGTVEFRLPHVAISRSVDPTCWGAARASLLAWMSTRPALRVQAYERDAEGRFLADVYDPTTGQTASSHLIRCGWTSCGTEEL